VKLLTDAEALARLERATAPAKKVRGLKTWAKERGLNYTYVVDILAGRRTISPNVAKAIGLERVEGWRVR